MEQPKFQILFQSFQQLMQDVDAGQIASFFQSLHQTQKQDAWSVQCTPHEEGGCTPSGEQSANDVEVAVQF